MDGEGPNIEKDAGTPARWQPYLVSFASLLLITGLNVFALPFLGYRASGFIFLVGVLPIAVIHGLGPSFFFAVSSALIWDFFFIPPRFTFSIQTPEDAFMNVVYLAVAVVTGVLGNRLKGQEELLKKRERETRALYQMQKALAPASSVIEVEQAVASFLKNRYGIESTVWTPSTDLARMPGGLADSSAQEEILWCYRNEKRAGRGSRNFPNSAHALFPLPGDSGPCGVLIVSSEKIDLATERLIGKVARTIGDALERERHRALVERNRALEESEVLHQTLLNSVSHELRTPLTAILGNIGRLEASLGSNAHPILSEVADSTHRLNRTVTHLLDLSRVSSGVVQLKREIVDLNDFAHVCVGQCPELFADRETTIQESPSPVLVRADEKLLETALGNLLQNAVRHSPASSPIEIRVSRSGTEARIAVLDRGSGLPRGEEEKAFEKFYAREGSAGLGLGLSIVRTIVEAHGGSASLRRRASGGTEAEIRLPSEETPRHLAEGLADS